ncbi:hypothetical protein DPEC_G00206250 [Dallia pectoralis]|uniref:Uncharacterized protein n=1 Tax=Dallia pectoralis TaxID=75939 RepID=A0ACC2G4U4_DALPE|nr:hypothetical protein DPEC_G00206250 [Dallia pectoralis]
MVPVTPKGIDDSSLNLLWGPSRASPTTEPLPHRGRHFRASKEKGADSRQLGVPLRVEPLIKPLRRRWREKLEIWDA